MSIKQGSISFEQVGGFSELWQATIAGSGLLQKIMPSGTISACPFPKQRFEEWQTTSRRKHLLEAASQSSCADFDCCRMAIAKLEKTEAMTLVTGQQPGVLGGPLYTFYKILTTIVLADQLEQRWNIPVVPVYWNGGDDHDMEEMTEFVWPGVSSGPTHLPDWELPPEGTPSWLYQTTKTQWEHLERFIQAEHPSTDYLQSALQWGQSLWSQSKTWPDQSDLMWTSVFKGSPLLFVRPWEAAWRQQAAELMEQEIMQPLATHKALEKGTEALRQIGYQPILHKSAEVAPFFVMVAGQRHRVTFDDGCYHISGMEQPFTPQQLQQWLHSNPVDFSPSAVIRPLIQDEILPTAASVLGPGEMAYQAQLGEVYHHHNRIRPWLIPRFSATLIPARYAQQLDNWGFEIPHLRQSVDELSKQIISPESSEPLIKQISEWKTNIHTRSSALQQVLPHNRKLGRILKEGCGKMEKQLDDLKDRLISGLAQQNQTNTSKLTSIRDLVYPFQHNQERVYSLFGWSARFGQEWISQVISAARDWNGKQHQIFLIGER